MRIARTHALAIATAVLTVSGLGILGITNANAADAERVDSVCNTGDCKDFVYAESSGSVQFLEGQKVSADAKVCPGQAPISVNATSGYAISKERSSGLSTGGELSLMGVLNANVQKAGATAVAESAVVGQEFAGTVNEGNIGHAVFEAKVYKSSGDMSWNEYMYDEFNTVNSYIASLETVTPVILGNKLADGEYSLFQRPLTPEELTTKC